MTRTLLVIPVSRRAAARSDATLAPLVGDFPRRASATGTEPATHAVACLPLDAAGRAAWEAAKSRYLLSKAIDYDDAAETPAAALMRGAKLKLIAADLGVTPS